ncbi:hypothetical protein HZS55_10610 [Halosimplex rubrum]|uniref:DUF7115 domain-containing protein n=1 Tax=Halosimplex rubrum TaxID=869889 RepID=A0A7D5P431_9EURY|nr:hypothetical protein [Halosimplex rubrum]QLH77724.1 hypothetical protein HZS55_10610 [Halosimplex rubrum]
MDIPDLVKGALDGEEIQAGVSLGDEDAVCLTPTRTLVYRGEGLLSDEAVEEYSHDIEQLAVSEGRRKTKFTMQYIDGTQSFTVPANRGEKVLELFLEGVLKLDGVIEARESLAGVYRFSELTLIIAEGRLIKHIGSQVWSEDYEVYAYDDVTGLEFERASVATSIALSVGGRPQRIKVPNDKAPVVRQTLEGALFNYYDVANIDELNRVVGADDADAGGVDSATEAGGDDFSFGDDFDPLVSDEAELTESVDADERLVDDDRSAERSPREPDERPSGQSSDPTAGRSPDTAGGRTADADAGGTSEPATRGSDANAGTASESPDPNDGQGPNGSAGRAAGGDSPDRADSSAEPANAESAPEPEPVDTAESNAGADARRSEADSAATDTSPPDAQQAGSRQAGGGPPSQRGDSGQASTQRADAAGQAGGSTRGRAGDASADRTATADAAEGSDDASTPRSAADSTATAADGTEPAPVTREEFEAMAERLDELTDAVDRQNELLKRQHRALKQLVQRRDSE